MSLKTTLYENFASSESIEIRKKHAKENVTS